MINQLFTTSGIIATLSVDEVHRRLASFNTKRFAPTLPESNWRADLRAFVDGATLEGEFLDQNAPACAHALPAFRWIRTVSLFGLKDCSRLDPARTTRFPGSQNRPAWQR